jgi:hypothetical protein
MSRTSSMDVKVLSTLEKPMHDLMQEPLPRSL